MQWNVLGAGERVPGGWQIQATSLPSDYRLRARGFTTGGAGNNSSWFVESQLPVGTLPPVIQVAGRLLADDNEGIRLKVHGTPGRKLVIESSVDLKVWTPLFSNVLESEVYEVRDPESANVPMKNYRARFE